MGRRTCIRHSLTKDHGFAPQTVGLIAIVANVGALLGGICFGTWSEKIGRRKAIVIAAVLSIPMIPLWAYSHTVPMLALGGFLMQFMVQGAWGVIPAHLNELSPPAVRGTFPGFAYQLGNFFSSWNGVKQARLAEQRYGGAFAPVLSWTVLRRGELWWQSLLGAARSAAAPTYPTRNEGTESIHQRYARSDILPDRATNEGLSMEESCVTVGKISRLR